MLVQFAKNASVPLVGLNYKEVRGDAEFDMSKIPAAEEKRLAIGRASQWLSQHGKPVHPVGPRPRRPGRHRLRRSRRP